MLGRVLIFGLILSAAPARADDFGGTVAPFLRQHCQSCHGPLKQEAQLRFDGIEGFEAGERNLWTMVHEKVLRGEMPPEDRPRPDEAEAARFLKAVADGQRALPAAGGRRLNRRELAAALRDVTGTTVDFENALPGDARVGGFDTGADGLQEAADGVAQWLEVTRRAVEAIRFLGPDDGPVYTADLREAADPRKAIEAWKSAGAQVKGVRYFKPGQGLWLEARAPGERDTLNVQVPPVPGRQGVLRLTLTVSATKPSGEIPDPRLWVQVGGKDLDYREITAPFGRPQRLTYEVHWADLVVQSKGVTVHLSNKVEIPYAAKGFENEDRSNPNEPIPGGPGLYRPAFDRKTLPPEEHPAPFVVLQELTIEADARAAWPPAEWAARLPGPVGDDPESAERLLALWMERAWPRPVADAEREPFLALYRQLRRDGGDFDGALRAAFQSVLLSAPFRYQNSPAHPEEAVARHAAASRLSFMLTGGPPDAELRRLAAAGKLTRPDELDRQVDRLLDGPHADAFLRPFVTQWLEMDQPITVAQDHLQKQDFRFGRYLKESMREETIAYVGRLLGRNRPARELVVSDWTMMNDTLARHYGYEGVSGGHLRPVKLRRDDPRGGGILGHAGIQSMLTWMGENWVIYRGAWALRHVLDRPPPPPPLEVPELDPSEGKNLGKPFRELLVQHQQDVRCSVCHKSIDPVGFAFQNFDLSGRWREVEHTKYERGELDGRIMWRGAGETRPVDAAGRMERGEAFESFAEFKNVLLKHYQDDMVRGLLKNLFVYATGRLPDVADMNEIRAIMDAHRPAGYPLRDLLKAVVRSRAFLDRSETPRGRSTR